MDSGSPPTLESFYRFCAEKKLMAARCKSCGVTLVPPRALCPRCSSTDMQWTELKGTGRLLTYSVVHVAPPAFQSLAPYAVGIVLLDEGARLPGMIRVEPRDLRIGLRLKIAFESSQSDKWPSWTRYFFVKADSRRKAKARRANTRVPS